MMEFKLEVVVNEGEDLCERLGKLDQEMNDGVRLWREWEKIVSRQLSPRDRDIFLSFRSEMEPAFTAEGLRLQLSKCVERQLVYLRHLDSNP